MTVKGSTSPSRVPVSGVKLGAEEACRAGGLVGTLSCIGQRHTPLPGQGATNTLQATTESEASLSRPTLPR